MSGAAIRNRFRPFLVNLYGEPRFQLLMEKVKHQWEHFEVRL